MNTKALQEDTNVDDFFQKAFDFCPALIVDFKTFVLTNCWAILQYIIILYRGH